MVVAVVILLLLSFVEPVSDANLEPETAIIAEPIIEDNVAETDSTTNQTSEPAHEEENKLEDLVGSFDESALEEESGNVQEGIDLLNSPLQ